MNEKEYCLVVSRTAILSAINSLKSCLPHEGIQDDMDYSEIRMIIRKLYKIEDNLNNKIGIMAE